MSRRLLSKVSLAALALAAGCAVRDLPDSVRPRGGSVDWPDVLAPAPARLDGRRDGALILSVEDYRGLPDRAQAHALAGAWYRYLHEQRGLRARRIWWLRDGAVTPAAVRDALAKAHFAVGRDATLWIVVIGHIASSPKLPHGVLLGPESTGAAPDPRGDVPVLHLLGRGGHGAHRELVTVLDGCLPGTSESLQSGVTAPPLPSVEMWLGPPPSSPAKAVIPGVDINIKEYLAAMMQYDAAVKRREPADTVVFTAGVGPRCAESLPGSDVPALSYLLLGALRGWADGDGDGRVTASEAVDGALRLLRGGERRVARPEARGADVVLAYDARERGPHMSEETGAVADGPAEAASAGAFVDDRMIKIDRGRFTLGCRSRRDRECEPDERPPRRIYLDSFAIDAHEVSWRDYAGCVEAGGCSPIAVAQCEVWTEDGFRRGAEIPAKFLGAEQPVVCATWAQAAEFCAWAGKRLPTEVEWERAARGPSERAQYPWGDAPPTCERAQNYQCGYVTAPVGGRPAGRSPDGVHDLAGNVSEWVDDWYQREAYHHLARRNPAGPDSGRVRVVRGGSFYDGHGFLRASYRYGLSPQFGFGTVGFRCAR